MFSTASGLKGIAAQVTEPASQKLTQPAGLVEVEAMVER
jgi:hypothetical protein